MDHYNLKSQLHSVNFIQSKNLKAKSMAFNQKIAQK